MVIVMGVTLASLHVLGADWPVRPARIALLVGCGVAAYYVGGVTFSAVEAHRIAGGQTFAQAVGALEPWQALVLVPAALAVLTGFSQYARAAWRMTSRQRAVGREAIRAAPARYTGKIPRRVRRRSPAALAGYELPLAAMGFPGVGWLFAGFPFTASILLMAGPVAAWAVIPIAFSPYAQGPLRTFGWKVELVYLPLSAMVSAAALYRAHARRRALLDERPPRGRRRRAGSYRTRVGIAVGTIALLLVSLPFVPAVAGIGTSGVRYAYQTSLPRDVTGQFLQTARGPVKLFSWGDPQSSYPSDALRVHPADVGSLLVRAAAVDDPKAYQLYDLDRGGAVSLRVLRRTPTTLALEPTHKLPAGRYAFVATHEGMFGGRDFDYLTVMPPGRTVTAISSNEEGRAPQIAGALLPILSALIALIFAVKLMLSWLRRRAGQKLFWAIGFALFALAATSEALAFRHGWNAPLFQLYYLAGGVLTVGYLGAGSAWLLLPRRARDVMLGVLCTATAAAAGAVLVAPVHVATLAATSLGRPPSNHALGGSAFVWAIALNSFGSIFLIGGSAWSIIRRQRIRTNVWIGAGALVTAVATGLSRADTYSLVYIGQLIGITMMFCGFALVGPVRARRPKAVPAAPVPAR
jgi:hypothetical protein